MIAGVAVFVTLCAVLYTTETWNSWEEEPLVRSSLTNIEACFRIKPASDPNCFLRSDKAESEGSLGAWVAAKNRPMSLDVATPPRAFT